MQIKMLTHAIVMNVISFVLNMEMSIGFVLVTKHHMHIRTSMHFRMCFQ